MMATDPGAVTTHAQELRLALLVMFVALGEEGRQRCAAVLDVATATASTAPRDMVRATGATDATASRFGAARMINGLCGACGRCARGAGAAVTTPTLP